MSSEFDGKSDKTGETANGLYLDALRERYPSLDDRLHQSFLIALHSRGIASIDEIYEQARQRTQTLAVEVEVRDDANVQVAHRWDDEEKRHIREIIREKLATALTREEIDDLVNLTRKRAEAQTLEEFASLPTVSFGVLAQKVRDFCRLPAGMTTLSTSDSVSVRLALIRKFISEQLEYQGVAKHYLLIRDFEEIVDQIIGTDEGAGLIGGKAGGMLLGAKILSMERAKDPSAPDVLIRKAESFFLRSDAMTQFIRQNGLQHVQDHKYRDLEEIRNDYPLLLDVFKNATFPPSIVERLGAMLDRVGTHPLIVRSSSLLEDRFGATFAGKYRSVFVCNQGPRADRLAELLGAIAEVYASTLHPDPISYRRRNGLLDFDDKMAILVQKVVGCRIGRYFMPLWAGVAFSHNIYRRNPRVRPEDGMARMVFGLGTRAVDRVGSDVPRIIPLGLPTLRPEVKPGDLAGSAQQQVDVINLEKNRFESLQIADVLAEKNRIPGIGQVFSSLRQDVMRPLVGDGLLDDSTDLVVTFDRFARSSPYPGFIRWCLKTLERAYGCPVDIEFAFDGESFNLLQCRPQAMRKHELRIRVPSDVEPAKCIFSATHDIVRGSVKDIEYIVLIDPLDYNNLSTDERRIAVGVVVRRLNQALKDHRFILIGPGRWGSRDLRMGIRTTYSDINNTRMLIEVARRRGGYTPDVSFGSHFFQDLVESDIHYLALYPEETNASYNDAFLQGSPNTLTEIVPDARDLAGVVRLIHIPRATKGSVLRVDMDDKAQRALGYLCDPSSEREDSDEL